MVSIQKILATLFLFEMPLKQQKQTRYTNEGIISSGFACVCVCVCVCVSELERQRPHDERWEEKEK